MPLSILKLEKIKKKKINCIFPLMLPLPINMIPRIFCLEYIFWFPHNNLSKTSTRWKGSFPSMCKHLLWREKSRGKFSTAQVIVLKCISRLSISDHIQGRNTAVYSVIVSCEQYGFQIQLEIDDGVLVSKRISGLFLK